MTGRHGPLLVLDAHGVVFDNPLRGFISDLALADGRDPAAVWSHWSEELRIPFWAGALSRSELWRRLAPGVDERDLEAELDRRYRPGPLFELVVSSRRPIWLFSNHRSEWLHPRLERFGLADRFGRVLVSDRLGVVKPSPAAFRRLAATATPQEVLYVDDSRCNVAAACAVGIDAHHVDDAAGLLF